MAETSAPTGSLDTTSTGSSTGAETTNPTESFDTTSMTSTGTSEGSTGGSSDSGDSETAPQPICGDGMPEGDEQCDDGNPVNEDACTNMCTLAKCGDGIEGPGEACDDGNEDDDDACTNVCSPPNCGDGIVQDGEECDDAGQSATCDANCTLQSCGDSTVNEDAGEQCDDGGPSLMCDDDCTIAACGDGHTNEAADEECDTQGETAQCDADCSLVECGDGQLNVTAGEACDDAGESPSCDSDCSLQTCGDATVNIKAGEACDDGNDAFEDSCSPQCLTTPVVLAPGVGHMCGIAADRSVHCWGWGNSGQLGQGNTLNLGDGANELPTPPVPIGGDAVELNSGGSHSCVRLDTGSVRCWGLNDYGQLGQGNNASLGDSPNEMPPAAIVTGGKVLHIGVGGNHTCVILEGGAVNCWGRQDSGQLGYTSPAALTKPGVLNVGGVQSTVQLALGNMHTCALSATGQVRCWGNNGYGQLGLGHDVNVGGGFGGLPPLEAKVGDMNDPVRQIAAGESHNCALLNSGKVRCWGSNEQGQGGADFANKRIGNGPGEMPPSDVDLGGPAVQVVAGLHHSCALMATGSVKCWGEAMGHGNPGLGNLDSQGEFPPPDVVLGGKAASLSSHAGEFSCALLVDTTVRCWGRNTLGQLGLGHTMNIGDNEFPSSTSPVPL